MNNKRIITWDDTELPFAISPSIAVPTINHLRMDVNRGDMWWSWSYKGLIGYLSPSVLSNALYIWDATKQNRHRREPVPNHVGRFFWAQTVSLKEAQESIDANPGDGSATGSKA